MKGFKKMIAAVIAIVMAMAALGVTAACSSGSADTVTVSFDVGKKTGVPSVTREKNGRFGELPEPTKAGYDFDGWYTQKEKGERIEPETTVGESDRTLYAHWTVSKYDRIAHGSYYCLAIDNDGNLWAWGDNLYGKLGDGTQINRTSPVQIMKGTKFVHVSAATETGYAIDVDGNLWAWGRNDYGQLGNGTTEDAYSPIKVMDGTKFRYVSSRYNHVLAIDADADLWAWGNNYSGKLGDGTYTDESKDLNNNRYTPIKIKNGTKFVDASAGYDYSAAIDSDGELWLWGNNVNGQMGNAPHPFSMDMQHLLPGKLSIGGNKVKSVVANDYYGCAIDENGDAWVWGRSYEMGLPVEKMNVYIINKNLIGVPPIKIEDVRFERLGVGANCAIDMDGKAWIWGTDDMGLYANGADFSYKPQAVLQDKEYAYFLNSGGLIYTMDFDGNIQTGGRNSYGEVGNGRSNIVLTPTKYQTDIHFTQIANGASFILALDDKGGLYSGGANTCGQLGDGTYETRQSLKQIVEETRFAKIAVGNQFGMAIDNDGKLWSWGKNDRGQLGDGTKSDRAKPCKILPDKSIMQLSVNDEHSLALDSDGRLWAWGRNYYGQVGNGTNEDVPTPVQILSEKRFVKIEAGQYYSMAIDTDGNLWTWGDNRSAQLGDGTFVSKNAPIMITAENNTKFAEIAAGNQSSYAIDIDGGLWVWGNNRLGQLGLSQVVSVRVPTHILDGTRFTSVSASDHVAALDIDGRLWAWGGNASGQLGIGIKDSSCSTPNIVRENTKFACVSVAQSATWAIDTEGNLWACGNSVGDGTRANEYFLKNIVAGIKVAYATRGVLLDKDGGLWAWGGGVFGGRPANYSLYCVKLVNESEVK